MIRSYRDRLLTPQGLAAIFVAILPFVYFFPALCGGIVLCPDDALIQNLPLRVTAAEMLRAGNLPFWNPFAFGGMPLFASAQGGLLFPLNWFFLFLPSGIAMNLAVLLTYSVAGLGAFWYGRRTGATILGGLITAIVWQCCGFLIAQIGHTNIIQTACILPWLLWSIDGYGTTGLRHRGVLVALFVALTAFAGHPQTFVYSLLLATTYAGAMALTQLHRRTRRFYLQSIGMIMAGLLLSAVQIWPTLELLRNSLRNEASYEFFTSFSLPPVFLLTFLAPFVVGGGDGNLFRVPYLSVAYYGEYIGYVGLIPFALAALAPVLRRDRVTIFWTCAAVVSLALALGHFWPFDLYRLIYHLPLLNLFRVPARHLMEFDFALAVLAGRAATHIAQPTQRRRSVALGVAAFAIAALTLAVVTIWRPAEFRLGRIAPVSILRAPELFVPLVLAALSGWALVRFARGRRLAGFWLVTIILLDLGLWGESSGWRVGSPRPQHPLFQQPAVVTMLRHREGASLGKYRVLTLDAPLPASGSANSAAEAQSGFELALQPDIYGMHRIENEAGYDGFGLARQSRLAGDMKVWGALTDPARSLFASRELDLLNVRYLLSRARHTNAPEWLPAKQKFGDFLFHEKDLGLPLLKGGNRIDFDTPLAEATRAAVVTSLAWSSGLADGTTVATLSLQSDNGRTFRFDLRAGFDSSEWAFDRPALKSALRHSRAAIAASSNVEDRDGNYEGHSYVSSFVLPEKATIVGGSVEILASPDAPKFGLSLLRMSLVDETNGQTIPLRREWISGVRSSSTADSQMPGSRWISLPRAGNVIIHQNTRALPRAWLASEAMAVPDETKLAIIRTGKLPDGAEWDPRRTVLLDRILPGNQPEPSAGQTAEIVRYEPNRVDIVTFSPRASLLVLSENHYPGWDATVDRKRVPVLRVNYNLRGVSLEPGSHAIRFRFRPRSIVHGFILSAATALLFVLWGGWRRRKTGGSSREQPRGVEIA